VCGRRAATAMCTSSSVPWGGSPARATLPAGSSSPLRRRRRHCRGVVERVAARTGAGNGTGCPGPQGGGAVVRGENIRGAAPDTAREARGGSREPGGARSIGARGTPVIRICTSDRVEHHRVGGSAAAASIARTGLVPLSAAPGRFSHCRNATPSRSASGRRVPGAPGRTRPSE
jgi:hypothetical protein